MRLSSISISVVVIIHSCYIAEGKCFKQKRPSKLQLMWETMHNKRNKNLSVFLIILCIEFCLLLLSYNALFDFWVIFLGNMRQKGKLLK